MGDQIWIQTALRVSVKAMVVPAVLFSAVLVGVASPAAAATSLDPTAVASLDGPVGATEVTGDSRGIAVLQAPQGSFNGFPTQGDSALILSTGDAKVVADPAAGAKENVVNGDQIGTDLAGAGSADGNDLTQVRLDVNPPADATCVVFDFVFLSEEFPNYVGQDFNDIFTAEKDATDFDLKDKQVSAPNNFAYSEDNELLSVNTFTKFTKAEKSTLNGKSPVLSASSPLTKINGQQRVFLTVQDLGDSDLDTAVVVDNLRYSSGKTCGGGIESIVDTDGDSLSDEWETNGIDYDGDGKPELDLKAMGADPNHKDIFIELDWMYGDPDCVDSGTVKACGTNPKDKTPDPKAVAAMVETFANAPVQNPDKTTGIKLHIDGGKDYPMNGDKKWGDLSKANSIPYTKVFGTDDANQNYNWTEFDKVKDKNFEDARKDAFHYTLYTGQYGSTTSSGISRGLPGGDLIVAEAYQFSLQQEAGTLMHEFGHNLGLTHAAKSESTPRFQPGYISIMNYCFQFPGVNDTDTAGTINGLDFSRGAAKKVKVPCTQNNEAPANTPKTEIDAITYNDWDNIEFDGGSVGDLGMGAPEPTTTENVDPLTEEEAKEMGVFAGPGDGVATVVGPDLFAAGVDGQVMLIDVTNPSTEETTYRVEVDEDWLVDPVEVTVAAGETKTVELPVKTEGTTDGSVPLTVSLYNGDVLVSESTRDVQSVDLTDPAVAADVENVIEQLNANPPEGYRAEATKQLEKAVKPVLAGEVTPEIKDDSSSTPWALIIGGVVLVLAVIGGGIALSRRKPSAPAA